MPFVIEPLDGGKLRYTAALQEPLADRLPRLDPGKLKPGDIVVWYHIGPILPTKNNKVHASIRTFGRGAYSHAEIVVGHRTHRVNGRRRVEAMCVGAGLDGVYHDTVYDTLEKFEIGTVLRLEDDNKKRRARRLKAVIGYLRKQVGTRGYGRLDAAMVPIRRWAGGPYGVRSPSFIKQSVGNWAVEFRKRSAKKATYCSQLVVEAYAGAMIFHQHHVDQAAFTPNDLLTETVFTHVGFLSEAAEPKRHRLDVNLPKSGDRSCVW